MSSSSAQTTHNSPASYDYSCSNAMRFVCKAICDQKQNVVMVDGNRTTDEPNAITEQIVNLFDVIVFGRSLMSDPLWLMMMMMIIMMGGYGNEHVEIVRR